MYDMATWYDFFSVVNKTLFLLILVYISRLCFKYHYEFAIKCSVYVDSLKYTLIEILNLYGNENP